MYTVIPQIQPAGTILFWGSEGRVLIKGGLYLRAGSIHQFLETCAKSDQKQLFKGKNGHFSRNFHVFSLLRVQFKGGYYFSDQVVGAGSIQGRVVFEGGLYLRNYGKSNCDDDLRSFRN